MSGPLVVRPRRLTWMCWTVAVLLASVFALVGAALRGASGSGGSAAGPGGSSGPTGQVVFGLLDQLAMTGFGLVLAGVVLAFTRFRVVAGSDGLRVRNALGETPVPWELVRAVRFEPGDPWASLELQDDDRLALLAVQANDGERAQLAARELRRLLELSRSG